MSELAKKIIFIIAMIGFIIWFICVITLSIKEIVKELKQRRKK